MSDTQRSLVHPSFLKAMREHPASVGETYFTHMRFALRIARLSCAAAGAALIHAVLPALFETTAGDKIRQMSALIEGRH